MSIARSPRHDSGGWRKFRMQGFYSLIDSDTVSLFVAGQVDDFPTPTARRLRCRCRLRGNDHSIWTWFWSQGAVVSASFQFAIGFCRHVSHDDCYQSIRLSSGSTFLFSTPVQRPCPETIGQARAREEESRRATLERAAPFVIPFRADYGDQRHPIYSAPNHPKSRQCGHANFRVRGVRYTALWSWDRVIAVRHEVCGWSGQPRYWRG